MTGLDLLFQFFIELLVWLYGTQVFQFIVHLFFHSSDEFIQLSAKIFAQLYPEVNPESLHPLYILGFSVALLGISLVLLALSSTSLAGLFQKHRHQ